MRPALLLASLLLATAATAETEATVTLRPDVRRPEAVLYPAAVQVNGREVNQAAVGAGGSYLLTDAIALQLRFSHRVRMWNTPLGDLIEQDPNQEMRPFVTSHRWSLLAGTELHPLRGEGTLLGADVRLGGFLAGMAGVVSRQHWMFRSPAERQFFDTGLVPGAGLAVGARVRIGEHVVARLELANVATSRNVTRVSGCNEAQLSDIGQRLTEGRPVGEASARGGCDVASFEQLPHNVPLALALVRDQDGRLHHTLSVQLGAAVIF
jgi:hypothetical protein